MAHICFEPHLVQSQWGSDSRLCMFVYSQLVMGCDMLQHNLDHIQSKTDP